MLIFVRVVVRIDCSFEVDNPQYSSSFKPSPNAFSHPEPKPELGQVVVSEQLASSLTLSWSTLSGHFDGFSARISDREQLYDVVELKLSGTERNTTVQGLVDSTIYDIMFYGVSHGRQTPSVYFNTSTGTVQVSHAPVRTELTLSQPVSYYILSLCSHSFILFNTLTCTKNIHHFNDSEGIFTSCD